MTKAKATKKTTRTPARAKVDHTKKPGGRLRLEYVEAGTLDPNPNNWRKHSKGQLDSLKELIEDPEIGWAGVLLYNERTKRLIDGHARKQVADPKTLVPVLIGDWSEEAEAKLLATFDPIASMAEGDDLMYQMLMEQVTADSIALRDLIDITAAGMNPAEDELPPGADVPLMPDMELRPFEHYDYVLVLAKTTSDWEVLCELLKLKKVNCSPVPGKTKVGLGRAVAASQVISLLKGKSNAGP